MWPFSKRDKEIIPPPPKNLEVLTEGMNIFNDWYKKEFLCEFIKIFKNLNVKTPNGGSFVPSIVKEIYDPVFLEKTIGTINAQIIVRMSDSFYGIFCANYDSDFLDEYLSRQAFFFIKKITTDITSMAEANRDVKYEEIVDNYSIILENVNYILNDVQTIEDFQQNQLAPQNNSQNAKKR